MIATDFMYDNLYLSDFGCIICEFDDSTGFDTIGSGSEINFEKTMIQNGKRFLVAGSQYQSCIEAEFSICKNPDNIFENEDKYFTIDEQRDIMRWLNRQEMREFMILDDENVDIYFNGSFNVEKVEHCGRIVGFTLRFQSDRPFGYASEEEYKTTIESANGTYTIYDSSDDIGYELLTVTITPSSAGNLTITNAFDGKVTAINNCVSGETITLDNQLITTDNSTHAETIMDDFNFVFPRICNSFNNIKNVYTFSLPCEVSMKYKPTRKVGIV